MSLKFGDLNIYVSLAANSLTASAAGSAFDTTDIVGPVLAVLERGCTQAASAEIQYSDDNSTWTYLSGASIAFAASATGNPGVTRFLIVDPSARYYRWKVGAPATSPAMVSGLFVAVGRHDNYFKTYTGASQIVVV